ncbi:MAG: BRO family protein [bacterium]
MTNTKERSSQGIFESIRKYDEQRNEYWNARDLAKILEYDDYRNFKKVIVKAVESCKNSGIKPQNHFVDFNEMVSS